MVFVPCRGAGGGVLSHTWRTRQISPDARDLYALQSTPEIGFWTGGIVWLEGPTWTGGRVSWYPRWQQWHPCSQLAVLREGERSGNLTKSQRPQPCTNLGCLARGRERCARLEGQRTRHTLGGTQCGCRRYKYSQVRGQSRALHMLLVPPLRRFQWRLVVPSWTSKRW